MKFLLSTFLIFISVTVLAQKFKSKQSTITFFSEAAIEDIAAINSQATSLFNSETSEIVFLVRMDEFVFEKDLMQQHFNEKYLESHKYPTASFKGKIIGVESALDGNPQVQAKGKLTIHGQTKEIITQGTLSVENENIVIASSFFVELVDYKVKIPRVLWQNIAEKVEVKIEFIYEPL